MFKKFAIRIVRSIVSSIIRGITPVLHQEIVDIVVRMELVAASTPSDIDNKLVDILKAILGFKSIKGV